MSYPLLPEIFSLWGAANPLAEGIGSGIGPTPGMDLGVDVRDVSLNRANTQDQFFSNLPIALSDGY